MSACRGTMSSKASQTRSRIRKSTWKTTPEPRDSGTSVISLTTAIPAPTSTDLVSPPFSPNGSARYCYDYSDEELAQFVPVVIKAGGEGKKVQIYFNNHPNGSGAKNAAKLKKMIKEVS